MDFSRISNALRYVNRMFLVTSNKRQRLLYLSFVGQVRLPDLERAWGDLAGLVAELPPGFRLLVDFSRLESMELACAREIGRLMELADRSQVGMVVRVIPDPNKDIGMNILALFHYHHLPQAVICQNLEEAARLLVI